jgi:hypothetical protein
MQRRYAVRVLGALLLLGVAAMLGWDLHTPKQVSWFPASIEDRPAERADGLVLQHEVGDDVWASQGFSVYRSREGGPFNREFTLWPRAGLAWAGFSRSLRDYFGYQELVEVVPLDARTLLVFGGGDIYRVDLDSGRQQWVHRLRYFGRGEGRGVMPHGIAIDDRGSLYFGEYPTGPPAPTRSIQILRSDDGGKTWLTAHEFAAPESVRHVHGVQWDPEGRRLWVTTGDTDAESRIGWSVDQGRSFTWIGAGTQDFRACSLLFLPATVVWGPDAVRRGNSVWIYEREREKAAPSAARLPGPSFYAQRIGRDEGIVGLSELTAEAWLVDGSGAASRIAAWAMLPDPTRPHPGVRLARGESRSPWIYLNPLRTIPERSAIYRLRRPPG